MTTAKSSALQSITLEKLLSFSTQEMGVKILRFRTLVPKYAFDLPNWEALFAALHSEVVELEEAEALLNSEKTKHHSLKPFQDQQLYDMLNIKDAIVGNRFIDAKTLYELCNNQLEEMADVFFCFASITAHMGFMSETLPIFEYITKKMIDPIQSEKQSNFKITVPVRDQNGVMRENYFYMSKELAKSLLKGFEVYKDVLSILQIAELEKSESPIIREEWNLDRDANHNSKRLVMAKYIFAVCYSNISKFGVVDNNQKGWAYVNSLPTSLPVSTFKQANLDFFQFGDVNAVFDKEDRKILYRYSSVNATGIPKIEKVGIPTYLSKTEIVNHLNQLI